MEFVRCIDLIDFSDRSIGLFALYLAGYRDVALYDASWEEWGTDPKRPVESEGGDVS